MIRIHDLQREITSWQERTFPGQPVEGKIHHLKHEVEELLKSPGDISEAADCFILLMGVVSQNGVTTDNFLQAVAAKMEINRRRKWNPPNADGVSLHVKEGAV